MPDKTTATYVLAFSIFSLAIALIYFTVQIGLISSQVPEILKAVEDTSEKVEPVVEEIDQIRHLVPPILEEVQQAREQIPLILEEMRLVREQVPSILNESSKIREQVPAILDTANNASSAITLAVKEMEQVRPLVPQVLEQVEKTREAIPVMMDRGELLIGQAKDAGKEASKGAVTGILTGIITAPFAIVGGAGKKVFGVTEAERKLLSDKDMVLMNQSAQVLMVADSVNSFREWENRDSNHRGRVTLQAIDSSPENGTECRDVLVEVFEGKKSILNKVVRLCIEEEGNWMLQN